MYILCVSSFIAFVRPHLEYAQVVWAPHRIKYINMIENVQIRATKLVEGLRELQYSDRLKKLSLPTMVYRRACGDMIEMWKHFYVYDKDTITTSFHVSVVVGNMVTSSIS